MDVEQGVGVWNWGTAWLQFAACEDGKQVIPGVWRYGGLCAIIEDGKAHFASYPQPCRGRTG